MSQIFTKQLDYGASIVSDPTGKFRVVCREGSYRRKNKEFDAPGGKGKVKVRND